MSNTRVTDKILEKPYFSRVGIMQEKEQELDYLQKKEQEIKEKLHVASQAFIAVRGKIHEGVTVKMNNLFWKAREVSNVRIKRTGGKIALYTN